jgi:gas vesicle protein
MYYDEESGTSKFMAGVLVGAVLGAGVALLMAPQSGRQTRARIVRRTRRDGAPDSGHEEREMIMTDLKRRRRKARREA